jgi:uncharacterized protein
MAGWPPQAGIRRAPLTSAVMELPMFPLGTVLLPGVALPLHLFEPRYLAMIRACLDRDPAEFGVTLIERGSEVGGGDVRSSVGTVARVVQAAELDDGRWFVVALGTRRLRVGEWLPDDPYPRAVVEDWPDPEANRAVTDPGAVATMTAMLRRVLALRAELGQPAAPLAIDLADDPAVATWQVAAAAGLGPMDTQQVLRTEGADERVALVSTLLEETEEVLRAQLGS